MARIFCLFLLLALCGCSGWVRGDGSSHSGAGPCAGGENSYDCQVIRYRDAT